MSAASDKWGFTKEELTLIFMYKDGGFWNKDTWEGTRWQDTPDIAGSKSIKNALKNALAKSTMFDEPIKSLTKKEIMLAKAVFDSRFSSCLKDRDAATKIIAMYTKVIMYMTDTSLGISVDVKTAVNMYHVLFFTDDSDTDAFMRQYGKTFPRELSDDGWRSAFKALHDFVEGWID
jgi:hypothetical protein